ncbi:MAG: nucleoside deaminase [Patescibacteria group bacterium]
MITEEKINEIFDIVYLEVEKTIAEKNQPFGAVITDHAGEILAVAHNEVVTTCDPTSHAEINAIRIACKKLGNRDLSGCSIFVNSEPCPMCAAAIARAKIARVYYGPSQEVGVNPDISAIEIWNKSKNKIQIHSGLQSHRFQDQIEKSRRILDGKAREFKKG